MNYERINWQNGAETPLNKTNLNKMDKAISDLVNEIEKLSVLEVLGAFPNLSNSRISNCVNFSSTSGYTLTYGTLSTSDGNLIIKNTDYASTQLTAKLKKSLVLNEDKNILIKLRVKAITGSQVVIYPKIGLADGTSIFVVTSNIIGSNLSTNTTYPKYTLPNNKWVDIWYVFGTDADTEIDSVDLHIAPYATIKIASLQAFYSLDKTGNGGAIITDSNITSISVNYYAATTTNSNLTITPTTYKEGEI